MPALTIDSLCKSFGDHHVLHDLSFTVREGELYGFVGANGAGKSTTMRIALGVLSSDSGRVLVGDQLIDNDLRRSIGYMPEERGLYAKEPLIDQLVYLATLHGLSQAAAKKNAMALLERLGLGERAEDKLENLSLGNQQRVQLAASLVHDPEILILDEPFSGLDPVAVEVMASMLRERAQAGVPVLFSSHQLDLMERLCDRVGILSKGKMVAEGTVQELKAVGPVRFAVETPSREWIPAHTKVVSDTGSTVVVETRSETDDQDILRAALACGPVHSFTRVTISLTELFKEVMQA